MGTNAGRRSQMVPTTSPGRHTSSTSGLTHPIPGQGTDCGHSAARRKFHRTHLDIWTAAPSSRLAVIQLWSTSDEYTLTHFAVRPSSAMSESWRIRISREGQPFCRLSTGRVPLGAWTVDGRAVSRSDGRSRERTCGHFQSHESKIIIGENCCW